MTGPARVDSARMRDVFDRVAAIGQATDGSYSRLSYSDEEAAARAVIIEIAESIGAATRIDPAGNLWVTLAGSEPELEPVVTGSHLDTVIAGGTWDGALGVVAGLESLRAVAASGQMLRRSLQVIAFAGEESPRFQQSAYRFGSRAVAGLLDGNEPTKFVDRDGVRMDDAMTAVGLDPTTLLDAAVAPSSMHCVVELHIDQGLSLVTAGEAVGVVTAITGSRRVRVRVEGQADHSGAARMTDRHDALAAASEMVLAVESRGLAEPSGELVTTVGWIEAHPGSVSVVPGLVEFVIDIRSIDAAIQHGCGADLDLLMKDIAARRGCQVSTEVIRDIEPVTMDPRLRGVLHAAAVRSGLRAVDVPSHAGHDAGSLAAIAPVAMVFVRNVSGRSHSRAEHIDWPDAVDAAQVLTTALIMLADGEDAE